MPKVCAELNCKKQPTYNNKGEKVALYCATHKKEHMVDVKNKSCVESGCKKQPTYNNKGEKVALYCATHKKEHMVDIINKSCIESECKIRATYNNEGEKVALYCSKHKKEGMVDVKNKSCIESGCKKQPTYNAENEKVALYCSKHKKEGMVDVKNKSCIESECKIRATYNNEGETKGLYCAKHKKEHMVDVINKSCAESGCKTRPVYNSENEKVSLYCTKHKKEGMVNVKDKSCKTYLCETLVKKKYDGYCYRCFIFTFPDNPLVRNFKTKEKEVFNFLKEKYSDKTLINDKTITDGCSKRRPDVLIDLGYQVLIIEVDENKHEDYNTTCEHRRIMEISQDLGHRPVVFIRFNPDDYIDKSGKKVKSCWKYDKKGFCKIEHKKDWDFRLNTLKTTIDYYMTNIISKTVEISHLFFDE